MRVVPGIWRWLKVSENRKVQGVGKVESCLRTCTFAQLSMESTKLIGFWLAMLSRLNRPCGALWHNDEYGVKSTDWKRVFTSWCAFVSNVDHPPPTQPPWVQRTQKSRYFLLRLPTYQRLGQPTDRCASPSVRNSAFVRSAFPGHSTPFFFFFLVCFQQW